MLCIVTFLKRGTPIGLQGGLAMSMFSLHFTSITWLVGHYGKASLLDFLLVFVTLFECLLSSMLSEFNLLFFKINVGRVKFDWGAKNRDGALLVLVTERLVLGEALEKSRVRLMLARRWKTRMCRIIVTITLLFTHRSGGGLKMLVNLWV